MRTSTSAVAAVLVAMSPIASIAPAVGAPVKYGKLGSVLLSEISCHDEWVEIINTDTELSVKLGGVRLAQKPGAVAAERFTFAKTVVIKAGGVLLTKAASLPFTMSCGDEQVLLIASTGRVLDQVSIPNLLTPLSWSRFGAEWKAGLPSPAKKNAAVAPGTRIDRAGWIYSTSDSYGIRLTLDPLEMDKLTAQPKTYVPAAFQMQDPSGTWQPETGPITVGVRLKGGYGTRTAPKYGEGGLGIINDKVSLKIKFNFATKGQRFFGLKRMTLNNMAQDPTLTHETLAYQLFRDAGVVASRTGFATVAINGEPRGLYLNLEAYDDVSMAWWVPKSQHVYEGEAVTLTSNPVSWAVPDLVPSAVETVFSVDEGDKASRTDLRDLVAALQPGPGLSVAAAQLIDVDELGAFLAVEKYINHFDGLSGSMPWSPNNLYMVSDLTGRFRFMPAGTDQTWQYTSRNGLELGYAEPFESATATIFSQCLGDDRCASSYRRTLAYAASRAIDFVGQAEALFRSHVTARNADPKRFWNEGQLGWAWESMLTLYRDRPRQVRTYLDAVATGVVRWQPSTVNLKLGSTFSPDHLNAYSDILGKLSYSVALWSKPSKGKHPVTVTLTPADASRPAQKMTIVFSVS